VTEEEEGETRKREKTERGKTEDEGKDEKRKRVNSRRIKEEKEAM
jgi:hypothetical protein